MITKKKKIHSRIDCAEHLRCVLDESIEPREAVMGFIDKITTSSYDYAYNIHTGSPADISKRIGDIVALNATHGIRGVVTFDRRGTPPTVEAVYPVGIPLESVSPLTGICNVLPTEGLVEAYGRLDTHSLTFDIADYPVMRKAKDYLDVRPVSVDVIGFCYLCRKVTEKDPNFIRPFDLKKCKWLDAMPDDFRRGLEKAMNIREDGSVMMDFTYSQIFVQENEKFPDEFRFSSYVEELDEIEVFDMPMYRMKIVYEQGLLGDETDTYITAYAKQEFFPDGLKKGDFIRGIGWLQGVFR